MAITYVTVALNLESALEGGYTELLTWSPEDIAADLLAYSEDCENSTKEELIPHIQKWLNAKLEM
jgi:hypothetical protein